MLHFVVGILECFECYMRAWRIHYPFDPSNQSTFLVHLALKSLEPVNSIQELSSGIRVSLWTYNWWSWSFGWQGTESWKQTTCAGNNFCKNIPQVSSSFPSLAFSNHILITCCNELAIFEQLEASVFLDLDLKSSSMSGQQLNLFSHILIGCWDLSMY